MRCVFQRNDNRQNEFGFEKVLQMFWRALILHCLAECRFAKCHLSVCHGANIDVCPSAWLIKRRNWLNFANPWLRLLAEMADKSNNNKSGARMRSPDSLIFQSVYASGKVKALNLEGNGNNNQSMISGVWKAKLELFSKKNCWITTWH